MKTLPWIFLIAVMLTLTAWADADTAATDVIYNAWKLINQRLDEMGGLQGPSSVANFGETHKKELENAAKALADNGVTGVSKLVKEFERLKIRSFDNALSDFEKAEIKKDIAVVRLQLNKEVQAVFVRLVPAS